MSGNECELHLAEGEPLCEALAKQIDYYFSRANLSNDAYLVSQMDAQLFVPVATICNFAKMKSYTEGSVIPMTRSFCVHPSCQPICRSVGCS
jgi:hypothetical protein